MRSGDACVPRPLLCNVVPGPLDNSPKRLYITTMKADTLDEILHKVLTGVACVFTLAVVYLFIGLLFFLMR